MLKNVTLSADAAMIEEARKKAGSESTTLNAAFRRWLARYVDPSRSESEYRILMSELSHVRSGRAFSRDELNER